MNMLSLGCFVGLVAMPFAPASAESLRCDGHFTEVGDSRLSVLYKCGQPLLKDSACDPVYVADWRQPLPQPFANAIVPCQPVEQWLYSRGPGNLMATVRFRSGVVQSITYGRAPQ